MSQKQNQFNIYNKNIEQRIKDILLINKLEKENTKNNSKNETPHIKISSIKENINEVMKRLEEYTKLPVDDDVMYSKSNTVVLFDFEFKDMYVKQQFIDDYNDIYEINIFNNNVNQLTFIHSIGIIFLNIISNECEIYQIHMPYYSNIELMKLFNVMKNKYNSTKTKTNTNSKKYNEYFMNLNEYYEYRNYKIPQKDENNNIYIEYDVRFNIYKDYEKHYELGYFNKLSNEQMKEHIDYFNENYTIPKTKISQLHDILYNIFTTFKIINKGDKDFFIFTNSFRLFCNKFKILSFNKNSLEDIIVKDVDKKVKTTENIDRVDIDSIYSIYGYNKMDFTKMDYWDARDETLRIKKDNNADVVYNTNVINLKDKEKQKTMRLIKLREVYNKYIVQTRGKKTKVLKYIIKTMKLKNSLYSNEELIQKLKQNNFLPHIALEDTLMTFYIFLGYKKI
jgi:hypothetical protein